MKTLNVTLLIAGLFFFVFSEGRWAKRLSLRPAKSEALASQTMKMNK